MIAPADLVEAVIDMFDQAGFPTLAGRVSEAWQEIVEEDTQVLGLPVRVTGGGRVPTRSHPGDAGLDLYAAENRWIEPGVPSVVDTGVQVAIPHGHAGLLVLRSSAPKQYGVAMPNGVGVIDSGYRGTLGVQVTSVDDEPVRIQSGDRIAQLVIVPVRLLTPNAVDVLPDSDGRGSGGFGSTGQ